MVGDLEVHFAVHTAIHCEVAIVRRLLGHLRHVLPNLFCKVHRHSCIDEIRGGDDFGVRLLEKSVKHSKADENDLLTEAKRWGK